MNQLICALNSTAAITGKRLSKQCQCFTEESLLPDSLETWLLFLAYLPTFKNWPLNHPAEATTPDLEYQIPVCFSSRQLSSFILLLPWERKEMHMFKPRKQHHWSSSRREQGLDLFISCSATTNTLPQAFYFFTFQTHLAWYSFRNEQKIQWQMCLMFCEAQSGLL